MKKKRKRIYLSPKPVFTVLSILTGIILVLLLPALYKILTNEFPDGFEYKSVLPDQIWIDGILGILAGVAFAVFGLFRFDEALLVRLIRILLLIITSLIFLTYITYKSMM